MRLSTLRWYLFFNVVAHSACRASSPTDHTRHSESLKNHSCHHLTPSPPSIHKASQTQTIRKRKNTSASSYSVHGPITLQVEAQKAAKDVSISSADALAKPPTPFIVEENQNPQSLASRRSSLLLQASGPLLRRSEDIHELRRRALDQPTESPFNSRLPLQALGSQVNTLVTRSAKASSSGLPSPTSASPHPQSTHIRGQASSAVPRSTGTASSPSATSTAAAHSGDDQASSTPIFDGLKKFYQPSYRLYALVILLTIAIAIVILLIIISGFKYLCHRPKFANRKDYPEGFPWEARASQYILRRSRIAGSGGKSALFKHKSGFSPFTHTPEGNWDQLEDKHVSPSLGHQMSMFSSHGGPEIPSSPLASSDLTYFHSHSTVEHGYSSTNNTLCDPLTPQTCEESIACPSSKGLSSSSSSTGDSSRTTTSSKDDHWNTHITDPALVRTSSDKENCIKETQCITNHAL